MKIVDVRCHVLLDPGYQVGATSSAQDDLVVEILTDEGITGIGETDMNPWIGRACIEAPSTHSMGLGLRAMLLGEDPLQVERLWDRLYHGSAMNGRRGAVIHALGAIDTALHDLRGKALGRPCHSFLGEVITDGIAPYASLLPDVTSFDHYRDSLIAWARDAKRRGFTAAKLEMILGGPYAHMGIREPWSRGIEILTGVREAVGPDFTLMVDVAYGFAGADECLRTVADWQELGLCFLETPVPSDDLDGLGRVSTEQGIPTASGEWLATRFEFDELVTRGRVAVVQPDIGRVGGLTEAMRVCQLARARGLRVVPHLWNTGISVAAATHLAAVTSECPFIEYLPPDLTESALRRDLVTSDAPLADGRLPVPMRPGLGVEIDWDALERFERAAAAVAP